MVGALLSLLVLTVVIASTRPLLLVGALTVTVGVLATTVLILLGERRRDARLVQAFAATPDGIAILDPAGRVIVLNRRGVELLGVRAALVEGQPLARCLELSAVKARWVPAAPSPTPRAGIADHEQRGRVEIAGPPARTLSWVSARTIGKTGDVTGMIVVLRDASRERDAIDTDLVSIVSHELRTPLTSVKGALHLLRDDPGTARSATECELIDICLDNTDRLMRLVDDMLDVSRIDAGRMVLRRRPCRPSDLVAAAIASVRGDPATRRMTILTEMPNDLPAIRVDSDRIIQVLVNLLSNAARFSPHGSVITVAAVRRGDVLELSVRDRGCGIHTRDQETLFGRFQQVDSAMARGMTGSGLGLFICRRFVEEHGGRIWMESDLGVGTTVTFMLPIAATDAVELGAPRSAAS